jgi:nucleoid-associated protein YgaU
VYVKKMGLRKSLSRIIIPFLVFWWTGCQEQKMEKKGDAEARAGRPESAIFWYEGALGEGDRSSIHLKMAEIFATKLRDPSSAAYHYRRILALRGGGQAAETARIALRRIESGSASPENGPGKASGSSRSSSSDQNAAAAEREARGKVRTYLVQPGDTFTSISKKFYQTSARWKDILDANQNQVPDPDALKAGQTIILP